MHNLLESKYCQVAVNFPAGDGILTYQTDGEALPIGSLVEVPLGRRKAKGVVLPFSLSEDELTKITTEYKLKPISARFDSDFTLSEKELELYMWMSKYYHYNLGMLVWDCLPKILKRPREVDIAHGSNEPFEFELNEEQRNAFLSISDKLFMGFDRFYIHGVTGSGKTLIYLNLIKEVLQSGKSVLFLLPEINLTPQFTETFRRFLDCPILSYHSGVTDSHKNEVWKFLKRSNKPVLIMGVRSSVFLPSDNIGLVIVDEEHDNSFKQSDRCAYNGRDVAIKKAQIFDCPVVLGSATPSLENYHTFTTTKRDNYFTLEKRAAGSFPDIELIDSRRHGDKKRDDALFIWPFEKRSLDLITEALERKEQVLVFVNRLGFANFIQCRNCGHKFEDPNTGVPLRFFKKKNILSSGHSDYQIPLPEICPSCGNMSLLQQGYGTERLQEVLLEYFPGKSIERFDRDEITNLEKLEEKLDKFHAGETDIFVGTQMLSKGHNFKRVNLVLILGTDSMLNFPDFRSMEKTYQMLVQILGRAGRYSDHAKVAIQTLLPDNPLFKFIENHDFSKFYDFELNPRRIGNFPPFSKMIAIHVSGRDREKLVTQVSREVNRLYASISQAENQYEIWGPTPAMIERRANMFTWSFTVVSGNVNTLHSIVSYFENTNKIDKSYSIKVDVDPYQIL
ncbi:primosomal protein N' [Bacteriovorax sp. Seq25_V]|uniref:replication restart helicase PriA n=1 Tax=Bacteriovorax sp. Seq25_V TaxID=1201288 RepID=UPI00038A4D26|nr:primosomal protein N' [Bacteriovorax sp. Seq25_V]EQC46552.1 primosomal protein N' [Bacteriovorax sp. Seq25_V]